MSGKHLEPREDTRPPHRPRSAWRVLLLAAGMLVFLGLVAAVSRSHDTPGGRAGVHSPPSGVGDYLFSIFLLVVVAMFLFMLWLWLANRDLLAQQRQRQQRGGMSRLLIFLMALALFAAVLSRVHKFDSNGNKVNPANFPPGQTLKDAQKKKKVASNGPEFKWLPVFIATAAGLVVLGVIGVRSVRRERRGLAEAHALQLEFEELVEETLADLYAEQDARKAIIAAYARVERIFASYGLGRDPSEAPVEYLRRVLPELRASGAALGRLTNLFEWAKFSAHDVDHSMRDEAIGALVEVRDELRANRLEDEIRNAAKPILLPKKDPYERARGERF
jgi:hypothetical protein